jgi:hypothetical protein
VDGTLRSVPGANDGPFSKLPAQFQAKPIGRATRRVTHQLSVIRGAYHRPYQRLRRPTPFATPPTKNPITHKITATTSTSQRK